MILSDQWPGKSKELLKRILKNSEIKLKGKTKNVS